MSYTDNCGAGVVELVDARDSKSRGAHTPCRFESGLRHQGTAAEEQPTAAERQPSGSRTGVKRLSAPGRVSRLPLPASRL